jgi:hypothetical protein
MIYSLAISLGDLGGRVNVERAVELFEAVVKDLERVLGVDHPDTLASRNNLALALGDLGGRKNLERAAELNEAVVKDLERVLGVAHPDTLRSRATLAAAREALDSEIGR